MGGRRMGQAPAGMWAFGRKWQDQMCLLKTFVPTEGLWRMEEVVGWRGCAMMQDTQGQWPKA